MASTTQGIEVCLEDGSRLAGDAVVAGLGVILLFAYNWHAIPKFGKLGLVFGALVAAHAAGLWLFQRADWRKQLGEALSLLGTMLFGAGIWLVAQMYHIDEHYPNGFLLWAAGAVALAWTMPNIYSIQPGETMFTASDVGWVVGHSYIVYAPLLVGATRTPVA